MHHNIKNSTGNMLSIIILGVLRGMNRISKIVQFTLDSLLQKLFRLEGKISDVTIIDRLKIKDFTKKNVRLPLQNHFATLLLPSHNISGFFPFLID